MWPAGPVAGWTCGRLDLWPAGPVAGWICGRLDLWPAGFVAGWICGRLDLWHFGGAAREPLAPNLWPRISGRESLAPNLWPRISGPESLAANLWPRPSGPEPLATHHETSAPSHALASGVTLWGLGARRWPVPMGGVGVVGAPVWVPLVVTPECGPAAQVSVPIC